MPGVEVNFTLNEIEIHDPQFYELKIWYDVSCTLESKKRPNSFCAAGQFHNGYFDKHCGI